MQEFIGEARSNVGLERYGLINPKNVYWNLPTSRLYEEAIRRGEGTLSRYGPLVVNTTPHTGRSPNDKFTVKEPSTADDIWWGSVNKPFDPDRFEELHRRVISYLQGRDLFVQDLWAGADPAYRLPVRIINEFAWHNIFVRNMFINPTVEELKVHDPEFTVIDCARFHAIKEIDETASETFIIVNFAKKLVLIGGSRYGGEMKKSIFAVMNYLLPFKNVLPMHCSANYGPNGDTAIFFGLSGTGKTTLSADASRTLIGDDEHGWSDNGIFNFEGGCYAKMIRLSPTAEPEIYSTTRRFGTILENVVMDPDTRLFDLDDGSITENTRGAYDISRIENADLDGKGEHPNNVIFLTADAFGVLPPISKLTPEQAMYHFLSGYTAKVAGTERGVTDPVATFSACFGAPFLPLPPGRYAEMLGEKIKKHNADVWLVNTGWSGGPFGVGERMKIAHTRAMVNAALDGELKDIPTEQDPIFGLHIPTSCPNVPDEVLTPRNTWEDKDAYDAQAKKLATMFNDNFKQFEEQVSDAVKAVAPKA